MRFILLCTLLALSACRPAITPPPTIVANKPMAPRFTSYTVGGTPIESGVMLVIEVPVMGLPGSTEYQTCFVWRDTSGSQMQCPNDRRSYTIDPPEN